MRKLMLMLILLLFASSAEANVTDSLLSSKAEGIMGEMSHVKTAVQSYMRFVSYLDRTNNTTIRRPAMNMENFKLSWLQETLPAGDERPETALYPEGLGEVPNKAFLLTRSNRYNERIGQYRGEEIDLTKYIVDPAKQTFAELCLSLPVRESLRKFFKPPFIVRTDGGITTADLHIPMPTDSMDLSQYLTTEGGTVTASLSGSNLAVDGAYLRLGASMGDKDMLFVRSLEDLFVNIYTDGTVGYFTLPASERLRLQNLVTKYRSAFDNGDAQNASFLYLRLQDDTELKAFYDYVMSRFSDPEEIYDALAAWNAKFTVGGQGIDDLRKTKIQERIAGNMHRLTMENLALTDGTYNIDLIGSFGGNARLARIEAPNLGELVAAFYNSPPSVPYSFDFSAPNIGLSSTVSGSYNFFGEFVPDPSTFLFHIGSSKRTDISAAETILSGNAAMSSESTALNNLSVSGSLTATETSSVVFGETPLFQGAVNYSQGFRAAPNFNIEINRLLFSDGSGAAEATENPKNLEINPTGDVLLTGGGKLYVNGKRVSKYKVSSYRIDRDGTFPIPLVMTGILEGELTIDQVKADLLAVYPSVSSGNPDADNAAANRLLAERWFGKYKRYYSPYMTYETGRLYEPSDLSVYADIRRWTTTMELMRNACREIPEISGWLTGNSRTADDVVGITGYFLIQMNGLPAEKSSRLYTIAENIDQITCTYPEKSGKPVGPKTGGLGTVNYLEFFSEKWGQIQHFVYNGYSFAETSENARINSIIGDDMLSDMLLSYQYWEGSRQAHSTAIQNHYPVFGSTAGYNGLSLEEQVNTAFFENDLMEPFWFSLAGGATGYIAGWKVYFVPTLVYIREAK